MAGEARRLFFVCWMYDYTTLLNDDRDVVVAVPEVKACREDAEVNVVIKIFSS